MVDQRQYAAPGSIRSRSPRRRAASLAILLIAFAVVVTTVAPAPARASTIHSLSTSSAGRTAKLCSSAGKFTCFAERKIARTPFITDATNFTLTPANINAAYNLPASTLTNTVAIIDAFETPNAESDLAIYRAQFGLPACTTANGCFRKVGQTGSPTVLPTQVDPGGWASETALDLDSVSAACPTCHILLVEANTNDDSLFVAVKTATNLGAKFVSMSWGGAEMSTQRSLDATYFSAPGAAYFASTGDSGYLGGTSYPASSPKVIAVGGTSIEPDPSQARGWYEQAWGHDRFEGGGSGCSSVEAKPAFQSIIPKTVCAKRAVSDISAAADPRFGGLAVYEADQGGFEQIGGTSESGPLVAAMYASAGVPDPRLAPVSSVYAHASSFNDITLNANGDCGTAVCVAGAGWDGPTGLGTPNGVHGFGAIPTPNRISIHNPGVVRSFTGARLTVNTVATDSVPGTSITYTATGLPAGTKMYTNGTIIGNPTAARTYVVTVRATDATAGAAALKFSWVVTNHKIVPTSKPHIVGALKRGAIARVAPLAFRSDSIHGAALRPGIAIQWYVDGRAIRGAVHTAFKIPANYRGHRISFRVIASIKYYTSYGYLTARSAVIK